MRIQLLHTGAIMPTKGSPFAAAHDIYMPEAGYVDGSSKLVGLGFASEIPKFHVALLLPRSSSGAKFGLELNNTCGIIDSDYRGEWKAALKTKAHNRFEWEAGDRVLQFLIVPIFNVNLVQVESLESSDRCAGGFGSTGK